MAIFRYSPLEPNDIRLLELLPGAGEDIIRCKIRHAPLNDRETVFEAISYVWGNPVFNHSIVIKDEHIAITASLYSLLRRLRQRGASRIVWADGICINQSDMAERGQQVKLMRQLYERATRVIADIGENADDSDIGVELAHKILAVKDSLALHDFRTESSYAAVGLPPAQDNAWTAFGRLLQRPYFTRIWIIQELVVAPSIQMICGNKLFGGTVLYDATGLVFSHNLFTYDPKAYTDYGRYLQVQEIVKASSYINRMYQARQWLKNSGTLAANVFLQRETVFGATDPRDRIFAVLGLISRNNDPDLEPDYTRHVAEVFKRSFRYFSKHDQSMFLKLLYYVAAPRTILTLPSWVPDWTSKSTSRSFDLLTFQEYEETSYRQQQPSLILSANPHILHVLGVLVDQILLVGQPLWERLDKIASQMMERRLAMRDWILEAESFAAQAMPGASYYEQGNACWRTLIGGIDAVSETSMVNSKTIYGPAPQSMRELYQAFKTFIAREESLQEIMSQDPELVAQASKFLNAAAFFGKGRCVAATKSGLLCLLPNECEVGDSVIVLAGAAAPFVFRSCNVEWTLIGHGFVYGLNDHLATIKVDGKLSYRELLIK
jgi:hypothetical protein